MVDDRSNAWSRPVLNSCQPVNEPGRPPPMAIHGRTSWTMPQAPATSRIKPATGSARGADGASVETADAPNCGVPAGPDRVTRPSSRMPPGEFRRFPNRDPPTINGGGEDQLRGFGTDVAADADFILEGPVD